LCIRRHSCRTDGQLSRTDVDEPLGQRTELRPGAQAEARPLQSRWRTRWVSLPSARFTWSRAVSQVTSPTRARPASNVSQAVLIAASRMSRTTPSPAARICATSLGTRCPAVPVISDAGRAVAGQALREDPPNVAGGGGGRVRAVVAGDPTGHGAAVGCGPVSIKRCRRRPRPGVWASTRP